MKNWFLKDEIRIAAGVLALATVVLALITVFFDSDLQWSWMPDLGLYNQPEFWENILVESHGMLLDLLIIGIFIFYLQKRSRKQLERELTIKRYKEEIDDYRGWDEKEATYRIVGNVRRLVQMGETNINLQDCYLEGANFNHLNLEGVDLRNANLNKAQFWETNLKQAKFTYAEMKEAVLVNADLTGANLIHAKLFKAQLDGVNLSKADLTWCGLSAATMKGVKFSEAKLNNADFFSANLVDVDFTTANMEGAYLREATIKQINFCRANLKKASFEEVNIEMEEGLDQIPAKLFADVRSLHESRLPIWIEDELKRTHPELFLDDTEEIKS